MRFLTKAGVKPGESDALGPEYHDLPYGLVKAIEQWNEGNEDRKFLDKQLSKWEKHFKDLPKLPAKYKEVYRGLKLEPNYLAALLLGHTLKPMYLYESWTTDIDLARTFGPVLLKKKIPRKDQVVYMPELEHEDELSSQDEEELITVAQSFSVADLAEYREPGRLNVEYYKETEPKYKMLQALVVSAIFDYGSNILKADQAQELAEMMEKHPKFKGRLDWLAYTLWLHMKAKKLDKLAKLAKSVSEDKLVKALGYLGPSVRYVVIKSMPKDLEKALKEREEIGASLRKAVHAKYILVVAGRKERFKQTMLRDFYSPEADKKFATFFDKLLPKVINGLKRDDRIVWFLKKARGIFYNEMPKFKKEHDPMVTQSTVWDVLVNLEHHISNAETNHYQSIINYRFDRQSMTKALMDMVDFGEKEKKKADEKSRFLDQDDDTTFMRFKDGWEWHLLDRSSCNLEGAAMRHCGNTGSPKEGQRILSLREPVTLKGKKKWKPHATFIWNSDGSLGEMKGFANEKPEEKTHPYITALLENPEITKLKGGGYLAKNNFRVSDLNDNLKAQLAEKRNDLVEVKINDVDELVERINDAVERIEQEVRDVEHNEVSDYALNDIPWGERYNRLDDDTNEKIDKIKEFRPGSWKQIVEDCIRVKFKHGIGVVTNEINSHPLGQWPIVFSDDIVQSLNSLSEEEYDEVERRVHCRISKNHPEEGSVNFDYDRYSAIVDDELLDEKLKEIFQEQIDAISDRLTDKMIEENIDYKSLKAPEEDRDGSFYFAYDDADGDEQILYSTPIKDEEFAKRLYEKLVTDMKSYTEGGEKPKQSAEDDQPAA